MLDAVRKAPLPILLLAVAYVAVAAWSATWPDHPLFPDEAIAKRMADSVAERGTPYVREPFDSYRDGLFAPDPYSIAFEDHALRRPPTSIATAYEQGLLGPKVGRAITLAIGVTALAFLGTRLGGPWAGLFAGVLYMLHAGVLAYHQSYFANSGGTSWFLAAIALLDASRDRDHLARLSVVAAGIAVLYRPELALGLAILVPLAGVLLIGRSRVVAYYSTVVLVLLALWVVTAWAPGLADRRVFSETLPVRDLVEHPVETYRAVIEQSWVSRGGARDPSWATFAKNTNHYFPYFFPLASFLGTVGLFVRVRRPESAWIYLPLGAQTLLQAWAVLPVVDRTYWSNVSWIESALVRYFLVAHALTALLGGVALGAIADALPRLAPLRPRVSVLGCAAIALLVAAASVSTAWSAERGVAWANERRAWFDAIEAQALALGPEAVFVGNAPSKVVFGRPVINPPDPEYATFVALDLMGRGHRVFAFEPWYWTDEGTNERTFQSGGRTYWTDTGVQVNCTCGEFARFYELHPTNATLVNVARLEHGQLADDRAGLRTVAPIVVFHPERRLLIDLGHPDSTGARIRLTFLDEGTAGYEAGSWNMPIEKARNRMPRLHWQNGGTGEPRLVEFRIEAGEIMNGAFYVSGPPGLLLNKIEVIRR